MFSSVQASRQGARGEARRPIHYRRGHDDTVLGEPDDGALEHNRRGDFFAVDPDLRVSTPGVFVITLRGGRFRSSSGSREKGLRWRFGWCCDRRAGH